MAEIFPYVFFVLLVWHSFNNGDGYGPIKRKALWWGIGAWIGGMIIVTSYQTSDEVSKMTTKQISLEFTLVGLVAMVIYTIALYRFWSRGEKAKARNIEMLKRLTEKRTD